MYKKLEKLGSNLLGLFVPKVEASASTLACCCHAECWQCGYSKCYACCDSSGCAISCNDPGC